MVKQTPKKLHKEIYSKTDKSKWNSKIYSHNLQEVRVKNPEKLKNGKN